MIASEKRNLSFGSGNGSNLLDASFSSYLNSNGTEESFVVKLTHSAHQPTVVDSLSVVPNPSPQHAFLSKKKVEDGEIGVFRAEKYFKGVEDMPRNGIPSIPNPVITRHNDQLKDDQEPVVIPKAHSATPSIRSESSWNSRSGLLHAASRTRSRREQNKGNSNGNSIKSLFSSLGCHCNDKNSVKHAHEHRAHGKEIVKINIVPEKEKVINVEDLVRRNKSLSSRWEEEDVHVKTTREDCFSFPVLSSSKIVGKMEVRGEEETRNSLEVFGSPILEKGKKSFSLERKVAMLNWDGVTPRVENLDISKNGNNADAESDASSDLFEIESFSTSHGNSFLARQASGRDDNPVNDYAPSEASIEWSVVTASVAGFSVASDFGGDVPKPEKNHSYMNRNAKIDIEKRGTGILSGCTSLKSVRVAGDEQWTTADKPTGTTLRDRRRLESITPIVKCQAETKLMTGFDSRRVQNSYDPRSLARPVPSSASHNLYHSIA